MTLVAAELRLKADPRLIVPLDFPTVDEARKVVELLGEEELHLLQLRLLLMKLLKMMLD